MSFYFVDLYSQIIACKHLMNLASNAFFLMRKTKDRILIFFNSSPFHGKLLKLQFHINTKES